MKRRGPLVIGLTGSIGAGKSTARRMFVRRGAESFCADEAVHHLMRPQGKAFKQITKLFPDCLWRNKISRKRLGRIVFENPKHLKRLENILHPLVWAEMKKSIQKAHKQKSRAIILDVPLLFETGEDRICDATICVSVSTPIQKQRVLRRKDMTPEKLKAILRQQLSDKDKRKRADYVIVTNKGFANTYRQVNFIWEEIMKDRNNA